MIRIKSFARQKKSNSGGSSGGAFTTTIVSSGKELDTHYLWGQAFNGTQDIYGDLTSSGKITSNSIQTNRLTATTGNVTNISGDSLDYVYGDIDHLTAESGTVTTLESSTGTITNLTSTTGTITNLDSEKGDIADLTSQTIQTGKVTADEGTITTLTGTDATITNVSGENATFDLATLKEILSENITTENLTVTRSAHFFELIIDKIKAAGGAVLLTPSDGFKVEKVVADGDDYKLYWLADDGDKKISNMWEIGDQAICQEFNRAVEGTSYDVATKYYWTLVTDTGTETIENKDYHFIKVSGTDKVGTLDPEVGDEIAMLGSRTNTNRQSALYLAAFNSIDTGIQAPLIAQYEGINDFNLTTHRITWFAKNGNEVQGNLKVIVDGEAKTVQELIESEKESILEVTNERITAAVTEAKNYTDGREEVLRSFIQTTADNVLLSANNTSKDYTDGVATTLRGEIDVKADEITSTVRKEIIGSNLFLYNTSVEGWRTDNTTYPTIFFNKDLQQFFTLTAYYNLFSPVVKTNTVQKDYVISLYGSGTYYLSVYGFDEGEDYKTLTNWNSSHQLFNATSTNLTLLSGDTYNGLTRRYKSFNTNKKYLGIKITLVTAGNGETTGSRVAHIQLEEGTTPLAYNTGGGAIESKITQTAEQIIVDVKDLLINGDVTINGLITNMSGHINQQDLEDKDAVVIDFVNNKNITVENILDGVPLQLRNNGQIVYLPFYDTNYNDNLSGYVSQNPVVTASEFGFTKYGLHFEDSAINFTVPVYKTEGTQLRITNSYVPTINNWQNYANIYSNVSDSEKVRLFGQLLRSCVILCADPRLLTYRNYRGYYNSSLDGMIFDTSKGQQTSTTNVIDPSHSGAFLYNGLRSRFIFLLPSQSVNLRSQIINYGNGRKVLNWLVESTSDIKPIAAAIAFRYGDNSEYTTYYNEVIGGTSWQTQYTQVNDIMLGHDAINGDKLGTRPVYPIIQITNNTIANGSVPFVIGYEEM